jgi:hypothetical protein
MTGNPARVSDAELAELLAQHHGRFTYTQRRNLTQADRRQQAQAPPMGVELGD